MRFDALPNPLWARSVRSPMSTSFLDSQISADGAIITGGTIGDIQRAEPYIVKVGASGDTIWHRVLKNSSLKHDVRWAGIESIAAMPDGGAVVMARYGYADSPSGASGVLVRLNASGEVTWSKAFRTEEKWLESGVVRPAGDGFIVVTNEGRPNLSKATILLVSFDGEARIKWAYSLRSPGLSINAKNLFVDKTGNIFVLMSSFGLDARGYDGVVAGFEPSGALHSATALDIGPMDRFEAIDGDGAGGAYIAGTVAVGGASLEDGVGPDQGVIIHLGNSGQVKWANLSNGASNIAGVSYVSRGEHIVYGEAYGNMNHYLFGLPENYGGVYPFDISPSVDTRTVDILTSPITLVTYTVSVASSPVGDELQPEQLAPGVSCTRK